MLKTSKACSVCVLIKDNRNDSLLNRIYNSAFYMKTGETLKNLQQDYPDKFSYTSLRNHVKKHQFLSEQDFTDRHLKQIVRKAETQMVRKAIESSKVWDEVIDKGMESLENGELTITANNLLKAAKDKQDFEFKKKDQQLAMMEMVYHFASGENNQEMSKPYDRNLVNERGTVIEGETVADNDPAAGTADGTGQGTHQSGGVHYPPAWNAAT